MKVKELIEMLKNVDGEKEVLVNVEYGYGEGMLVGDFGLNEEKKVVVLWGEEVKGEEVKDLFDEVDFDFMKGE